MVRFLFFLIFIFSYSFSDDLVQLYRLKGIDALQQKLEDTLKDPAYWSKYLENKDVKTGYYEFDTPVVFVDKKAKKMKLYRYEDGKISLVFSEDVIVGKEGDKVKEGDLKTPVGVYEITRRFIPQDKFYGPVSYELSYPNIMDKLDSKNGYGIWIHGFPMNGAVRDERTKGCVAVENDILLQFDEKLGNNKSIVIISEFGDVNVQKSTLSHLLSDIFKWKDAWKRSDAKEYLKFYHKDFKRFDGKNKEQFSQMKRSIFQRKEDKTIVFSNLAISPYPDLELDNMFRVRFDEVYKTKTYSFQGKKELYVQMNNDTMEILNEK